MGRPKATARSLTEAAVEKALRARNGLITETAILLGCTQSNVSHWVKRSKKLQEVIKEIDERRVDIAENVLWNAMRDNNLTAAIFTLKTKGRDRGYTESKSNIVINNTPGSTEKIKGAMGPKDAQTLYIDMISSKDE